jgi:REP element-mobilizing transposase RayT
MARPPRLHLPGGCYHVTLRGNHREPLFGSGADRTKLNWVVADAIERFDARLHAFCWMTNHLHALVQVGASPLGNLVKSIATRFSRHRHSALDTTGHLFERRYGARLIDVDAYFLAVLRYIHLNPVKAGIVTDPGQYRWSSHRAYLGLESIAWLTTDFGLSLLGPDLRLARRGYSQLLDYRDTEEADLDDLANARDHRILGDDTFLARINLPLSTRPERIGLSEIAIQICSHHGVTLELLKSRASSHNLTPIRIELLRRAVTDGIASLTDVARYLGREPSTLSRQWKAANARPLENAKAQ